MQMSCPTKLFSPYVLREKPWRRWCLYIYIAITKFNVKL